MTSSAPTSLAEDLPDPSGRRSGPRWGLWAGVGAAAVAVVSLGLVAGTGDGLPRGTTVAGVEVGGMSETEAVATLTKALGAQAKAPIPATVNGDAVSIAPESAGLSFDAEATVAGLSGRIWNPVTLLSQFTGGPVLDPVVDVTHRGEEQHRDLSPGGPQRFQHAETVHTRQHPVENHQIACRVEAEGKGVSSVADDIDAVPLLRQPTFQEIG